LHKLFTARVIENRPVNHKNYLLTAQPLAATAAPLPGQFYMIETARSLDPLLKRPFSYFRRTPDTLQFLYALKGKGTALMSTLATGQEIRVIGPLGTGYPPPPKGTAPLLVAGGLGIASLFSFAETLSKKLCLLYGARCRSDFLMLDEVDKLGCEVVTCTDDFSFGKGGKVTDVVSDFLSSSPKKRYTLYACGPLPMLAAVSDTARRHKIRGFVSLEENMACGFGACLGCAVRTVRGYKRVCKEGPVFPIEEIVW